MKNKKDNKKEKHMKDEKKRKPKKPVRAVKKAMFSLILIIVLAVILAFVILYLVNGKGIGNGDGNRNNTEISEDVSNESESSEIDEIATENVDYAEVKVNENKYLFNMNIYEMSEIDKLINDIKSEEKKSTIRVIDDNASLAAYEALTDALKENDLRYIQFDSEKE